MPHANGIKNLRTDRLFVHHHHKVSVVSGDIMSLSWIQDAIDQHAEEFATNPANPADQQRMRSQALAIGVVEGRKGCTPHLEPLSQ